MPLIDLTLPAGALTPEVRADLAERLTSAVLRAERAPDTAVAREITWVHVHELPPGDVLAAGRPVGEPVFRVEVTVPAGVLSDRRRRELIAEATAAVAETAGLGEDDGLRIWVLVHDVPEGSWGAGGEVVDLERLRRIVSGGEAPAAAAGEAA